MTCMTSLLLPPLTSFPFPWVLLRTKWPNTLAPSISSDSSSCILVARMPSSGCYSHLHICIHRRHSVILQNRKSWPEHGLSLPHILHGMQGQVKSFISVMILAYMRLDLSTSTMESALRPLSEHLSCKPCREALNDRIRNLVKQWSMVKACFFSIVHWLSWFTMCRWPYNSPRTRYCDVIHDASTP